MCPTFVRVPDFSTCSCPYPKSSLCPGPSPCPNFGPRRSKNIPVPKLEIFIVRVRVHSHDNVKVTVRVIVRSSKNLVPVPVDQLRIFSNVLQLKNQTDDPLRGPKLRIIDRTSCKPVFSVNEH